MICPLIFGGSTTSRRSRKRRPGDSIPIERWNKSIRVKTPFEEEVIPLNDPAQGLYIGHMVWREMFDFSPGAVLLVLASERYTEKDYIRDYSQYIEEATFYFEGRQMQ